MRKLSISLWILAILFSHIMCAVVAWNYTHPKDNAEIIEITPVLKSCVKKCATPHVTASKIPPNGILFFCVQLSYAFCPNAKINRIKVASKV